MRSENEKTSGTIEALVLRRLRGELDAADAARLAAELARDPELAKQATTLERVWGGLELPPYNGPSVAPQVMARLRAEQRTSAPAWAKLAAAAALVAGVSLGLSVDRGFDEQAPVASPEIVENGGEELSADEALFGEEGDLAGESLWVAAEEEWQDEGEIQ